MPPTNETVVVSVLAFLALRPPFRPRVGAAIGPYSPGMTAAALWGMSSAGGMALRKTWRMHGGRGRGSRSATGFASTSVRVAVGKPRSHARPSREWGLRAVERKLVGVTATAATSAATVLAGPMIKSNRIINTCAFYTSHGTIYTFFQVLLQKFFISANHGFS